MHIEKNFCDNIVHTVMNVSGKTKDNEKARMDLPQHCKRPDMELKILPNGKYLKPKAVYSLTSNEAKSICQWLKELRMPYGYSSNLSRCADVNTGRLRGMKSHDSHVLMERLLPIAFSSLPNHVINPLIEISQFFRDLCASTLRKDELIKMDRNIPIILCKLEQVFPPGFFDSMEHLVVHLAYEAWLGGPVQYRWMYPFERFMGYLKRTVGNKSRVEGSIVAVYLAREAMNFCSHYFNHLMLRPMRVRNEVIAESEWSPSTLSVFRLLGSPSGSGKEYWMNDAELQSAEVHVLINCHEVGPYLHIFQVLNVGEIYTSFPRWFKDQVLNVEPNMHIFHLRGLADGPHRRVQKWHTYFVNGFKFHTDSWTVGKKTINSGVYVKGVSEGGENDFYGVIKHIFELSYAYVEQDNKVVLFYCEWFDPTNGTKIDPKYKTVDIRMDRRYNAFDPFILASKVTQVYYVPYPSHHRRKHGWCVAIKTKPRGQIETDDIIPNIEVAYQDNEMSHVPEVIEVDQVTNLVDREVDGQEIDAEMLFNDSEESSNCEDNLEEANNPEDYLM